MVEFNTSHKEQKGATEIPIVRWFKDGEWKEIDLRTVSTADLYEMRIRMERFMNAQIRVVSDELNNWEDVRCAVCDTSELAHRGEPPTYWSKTKDGAYLCSYHTMRMERFDDKEYQQQRKLSEIMG